MNADIRHDHSLDGDYAQEIGFLVLSFGSLEGILAVGIGMLVNEDQKIGLILTAKLSFEQRLTVFDALVRGKTTEQTILAALEALISRLTALNERRNGIVHAMWIQRKDGSDAPMRYRYVTRLKMKKGPIQVVEKTTPEEIHVVSEASRTAFNQACAFLVQLVHQKLAFDHGVRSGGKA
jgi:hypothetical protein